MHETDSLHVMKSKRQMFFPEIYVNINRLQLHGIWRQFLGYVKYN
jgi:hypothetical protein